MPPERDAQGPVRHVPLVPGALPVKDGQQAPAALLVQDGQQVPDAKQQGRQQDGSPPLDAPEQQRDSPQPEPRYSDREVS